MHASIATQDSQRHAERCAQGKTVEKVEAQETAYEKAFYPKHQASKESIRWLEYVAKGLDDSRQVTILRKTTHFLNLQDMFRQSFCHLQLNGLQSMQS